MNPKVDAYISRAEKWQEEISKLRAIVLDSHLTEELKWGVPCYMFQKANVVLIHFESGFLNFNSLVDISF